MSDVSMEELLAKQSVLCKGYGLVPRFIMTHKELSIQAKSIYAFLCCLSGKNRDEETGQRYCYPGVEYITGNLGITKTTFYTHEKMLLLSGCVVIRQTRGNNGFANNTYLLPDFPQILLNAEQNESSGSLVSEIKLDGIFSHGYSVMPTAVFLDKRLSMKSKSLYAYLNSYAGNSRTAFPSRDKIKTELGLSHPTVLKLMNELISLGYIYRKQRRLKTGSFGVNDYYIALYPKVPSEEERTLDEEPTEEPRSNFWDTQKWETEKPHTQKSETKNSDVNNNSNHLPITKFKNNIQNQSNLDSEDPEQMDRLTAEEFIRSKVKVENFKDSSGTSISGYLISLIAETISEPKRTYKINGRNVQGREVQKRLREINESSFNTVVKALTEQNRKIRNIRSYSLAALYNAIEEEKLQASLIPEQKQYDVSENSIERTRKLLETLKQGNDEVSDKEANN